VFFANLTLGQFLLLFAGIAAVVTALYLVDRTRRRQVVATLRFWKRAARAPESRRWRIRQPLSLLLQLLGIALLLLAIAGLRVGAPDSASRDHVLLLDSSAWMAAHTGSGTLMDEARSLALGYVGKLPSGDRVMVVRTGALATPATAFERDRSIIEEAIRQTRPGAGATHLGPAIRFASRILSADARCPGEIVFAGSARVAAADRPEARKSIPANFRYLPVSRVTDNAGLTRVALRHSALEGNLWEVYVTARNYSGLPRTAGLALQFAGAPAAYRSLRFGPGEEVAVTIPLRTTAAGILEVRLFAEDAFPEDDQTELEVASARRITVAVFSTRAKRLQALFAADPMVKAEYFSPRRYRQTGADIVVIDSFSPSTPPAGDAVWITPPEGAAGVRISGSVKKARIRNWRSGHPLTEGLRAQDLILDTSEIFRAGSEDVPIAEVAGGPVILARERNARKTVILGFHPGSPGIRYTLAPPLLFANIIRWMRPGNNHRIEISAGSPGTVEVPVGLSAGSADMRVFSEDGRSIPFTIAEGTLRFYSGDAGGVVVQSRDWERVYSLTLPAVPATVWEAPASVPRGIPAGFPGGAVSHGLWQWLALMGAAVLLLEWMWFGRFRRPYHPAGAATGRDARDGFLGLTGVQARGRHDV